MQGLVSVQNRDREMDLKMSKMFLIINVICIQVIGNLENIEKKRI